MKEKLIQHFIKHNYDYLNIDLTHDIDDIVKQVENDLIKSMYNIDDARKIMVGVWQLQKELQRNQLRNGELSDLFRSISQMKHYSVGEEYITCSKFIPCHAIKTDRLFCILDDNQTSEINRLGYGVTSFKIPISKMIKSIYCTGKHPNLNISSNAFCINFSELPLTIENLLLVEELIGQFNLMSCHLEPKEYQKLFEVVERCQTQLKMSN
jgi:hypothetical protein